MTVIQSFSAGALGLSALILILVELVRRFIYPRLFRVPKGWKNHPGIRRVSLRRIISSLRPGMPGPQSFSYLFPPEDPSVKSCYCNLTDDLIFVTAEPQIISKMLLEIDTFAMDGKTFGWYGIPTFDLLGDCLLTHDVDDWRKYHVTPLPFLKIAETSIEGMLRLSQAYIASLPDHGDFDVSLANFRFAVLAYAEFFEGKAVDGWSSLDPSLVAFVESVRTMAHLAGDPILCMLPTGLKHIWMVVRPEPVNAFYEAHELAMKYADTVLKQTTSSNEPASASIYAATAANGHSLDRKHLQRNLVAFNIAAVSTMGMALSAVLYHLAIDPKLQGECREEAMVLLQRSDIRVGDLEQLTLITAVIKEALRMYPPVIMSTPRRATKDCIIDGHSIPKDTVILADYWRLHRHPDHFEHPNTFDHTRWLPNSQVGASNMKMTKMMDAFKPFAAGPRVCPGRPMAMRFMRVLLCSVLKDCEISLPEDSPHKEGLIFRSSFMLDPVDLHLRVTKRDKSKADMNLK